MSLEQIKQVTGRAVYVPGDDIDTDQIIPARFLMCVTFDALGGQLFYDARFEQGGKPKAHPLNDARHTGAKVLLVNANFGCGSSREHAPQSIHKAGFRAIVGESFAEIFFGNSTTLGIPCVNASREDIAKIAAAIEQNPQTEVVVDVAKREIRFGGQTVKATVRDTAADALVNGRWDAIGELLDGAAAVKAKAGTLPYLAA